MDPTTCDVVIDNLYHINRSLDMLNSTLTKIDYRVEMNFGLILLLVIFVFSAMLTAVLECVKSIRKSQRLAFNDSLNNV